MERIIQPKLPLHYQSLTHTVGVPAVTLYGKLCVRLLVGFFASFFALFLLAVGGAHATAAEPKIVQLYGQDSTAIPLSFEETNSTEITFSQGPGQFTLLTLPTQGMAYIITHGNHDQTGANNAQPVLVSSDAFFTMETRLLLTDQDCQACRIHITRDQQGYRGNQPTLFITTYDSEQHNQRLAAEKNYRALFTDGLFNDFLVDAGQTAKQFRALNGDYDRLRACELDLFRVNESYQASVKVAKQCAQLAQRLQRPNLVNLFKIEQARYLWHLDQTEPALTTILAVLANEPNSAGVDTGAIFVTANADTLLGMMRNKKGDYQDAGKHFDQAIANFEMLGEKTLMADTLIEQGLSLRFRNQLAKAAIKLEQAYQVNQSALRQYDYQEANIKYHMAIVSALGGKYNHAMRLVDSLQSYIDNTATPLWRAHMLSARARIVMELGRLQEAEDLYQEVWQLYEQLGGKSHLGTVANNLANLQVKLGNFEQARDYLEQANHYSGSLWGAEQGIRIQQARINYYQANGNIKAALAELDKMAPLIEAIEDDYLQGRYLNQRANAQILANQPQSALTTLAQALQYSQRANDELLITRNHYLTAVALYRSQQPLADISAQLTKAINNIESARAHMTDDRVRQEYFALQKDIYELAIRANITLEGSQRILTGLYHAESFRARTLYENLVRDSQTINPAVDSDVLRSSFTLFQAAQPASQLPKLSFNQLQSYQQNLADGAAILYFFVGHEQSYVWFISNQSIQMQLLPAAEQLNDAVEPLITLMDQRPNPSSQVSPWQTLVANNRQVSDLLLGPLADELNAIEHLTVIPDGVLHRLPFGYLLDPNANQAAPLIASTSIRYASSIATDQWLNQEKPSVTHDKGILLVANPQLSADNQLLASLRNGDSLGNLPAAEQEANDLINLWHEHGDTFLLAREQATKQNFTAALPNQFQVVHFAGHATIDWDNPGLSAIKLAPNDPIKTTGMASDDLTLNDIAQLQLNAELVVLSACETAVGKLTTGEGPIGLSRAFFEAGSARVLASLWPVDDTATALLLKHFYQALLEQQLAPADALRAAQLAMLREPEYFHPFFWAGFIFVGKNQTWLSSLTTASSSTF